MARAVGDMEIGGREENRARAERADGPSFYLFPEGENWFGKMSEKAKEIASSAYERTRGAFSSENVSESVRSNRLVGKLGVAYNQFWLDRHEKKSADLKRKMDGLDLWGGAMDRSKGEIESVAEDFGRQNIPGAESLRLKVKDVEQKKRELMDKKDKLQSKFEKRENKVKIYADRRDAIADRLIGRYDEKLKPLENELSQLENYRSKAELFIAVTAARHKGRELELAGIEKRVNKASEDLRAAGIPEREIRKSTMATGEFLAETRKTMREEMANLEKKRGEINEKVARADKRANPYRDRREAFVRVKAARPLEMNVPARAREKEFTGREKTVSHLRRAAPAGGGRGRRAERGGVAGKPEVGEAKKETVKRQKVSDYIKQWNSYCKEQAKKKGREDWEKKYALNEVNFLAETGLGAEEKLDAEDFRDISSGYSRLKGHPFPGGKIFAEFSSELEKLFAISIGV